MMNAPHLQSMIRRNANEIRDLEVQLTEEYKWLIEAGVSKRIKLMVISPIKRKINKLAKLQAALKKEIADVTLYNRILGRYA